MEYYLGICSDGTLSADIKSPSTDSTLTDRTDGSHQRPIIWEPFKDFYKRRFLWYFESYLNTINDQVRRHTAGTKFKPMPFEGSGNTMNGEYQYVDLRRRLLLIRKMLDQETLRWADEGRLAIQQERPLGAQTMLLYKKTREIFMDSHALNVDIGLEDEQNPFVWIITYFGRPLTNLDGGMFRIRLTISPNFPDEWPRVVFETDLFHQRITREGVLCYVPRQYGELKNHVEAIVSTIEDEQPPYDPRVLVNLEASKLFWGSAEEKKEYNRRLRRSVQRSVED
jgi:ubiquitin-conjugating enzyme E2 Z